jgi:prepilin-type N-terminal cleavage/methylation domain-containing protein
MNLDLYKNKTIDNFLDAEKGFSLIETMIALTTLGVCLAYAMPLFLYAKINNSKSEIRTGALIVSQRVFDNIRSQKITSLPQNDGLNAADSTNPILQPAIMPASGAPPSTPDEIRTFAMGRQYQTKIIYCEDLTTNPTICSDRYRQFKVEVSYNGTKVYDLQGTYTQFE